MGQFGALIGDFVDIEEPGTRDMRGLVFGARIAPGGGQIPGPVKDAQIRILQMRRKPFG